MRLAAWANSFCFVCDVLSCALDIESGHPILALCMAALAVLNGVLAGVCFWRIA